MTTKTNGNLERATRDRYAAAAREREPELCCPVADYDQSALKLLPDEIVAKDYGCGNPAKYVREGESVVDLGSGAGKACYIIAHKVGATGSVIGVDYGDEMLALARKYQDEMAGRLGFANVRFVKARIQDLALDLERAEHFLQSQSIDSLDKLEAFEEECARLRRDEPLIPDNSVDVVVSNCVLNLVRPEDKERLFAEIHRVLRPGGRAVISDITCDENPTPRMMENPKLWSGCLSGAFREDLFPERFVAAGFHTVEILERQAQPWRVIDGIEFRSMTIRAVKPSKEPCRERYQSVIYRGPWSQVVDDEGHVLVRGRRTALCDRTFQAFTNPDSPYAAHVIPVPPNKDVPLESADPYDSTHPVAHHPRETKRDTILGLESPGDDSCCGGSSCC